MFAKNKIQRILVAPLDWGLGHTTRCIPIIGRLLQSGATVVLAGNAVQKKVLQDEFPNCEFLDVKGYNISYSRSKFFFALKLFWQIPKILQTIRNENRWLAQAIEAHRLDAVISDNRYGLYSNLVPSVFITHQLQIKAGYLSEKVLKFFNYRLIQKFQQCWIPDFETGVSLGGLLSHPNRLPKIPCKYIGPLSRMEPCEPKSKETQLLILLSGPEPQRTLFEKKVLKQIHQTQGKVVVVRGLPKAEQNYELPGARVYNHLSSKELNKEMCKASMIVCRSGYSSVMDVYTAGVRAILVPTPGQTEQEYLAKHLMAEGFCIGRPQKNFSLARSLEEAEQFCYKNHSKKANDRLQQVVAEFLADRTTARL